MALSWNEEFWSHPKRLLRKHLSEVGDTAKRYVRTWNCRQVEQLDLLAEIVGKSHDFGKYTPFFQQYLKTYIETRKREPSTLSRHSLPSAFFTAWLVDKKIGNPFLTYISFHSVLKHHSNLTDSRNVAQALNNGNLGKQMLSIYENRSRIGRELENEVGLTGFPEFIENWRENCRIVREKISNFVFRNFIRSLDNYFIQTLLFSSLVDADKKSASGEKDSETESLPGSEKVDEYRGKLEKHSKLDGLRDKAFDSVKNKVEEILRENVGRVLTITAPTGIGKTLIGFYTSMRLAESLRKDRIIYSLPFITIIDQNFDRIEKILGEKTPLSLLLKHHHLSLSEADESEKEETLILQESWDSRIVVTTFVQLLYTIIGAENGFLRRFHNLANSIILLDEVQAIPIEYWDAVKVAFEKFAELSNSHVILMTATQPLMFEASEELVPIKKELFESVNRYRIIVHPNKMSVEEFADWLSELVYSVVNESLHVLVVCNTIGSSVSLYKRIREKYDGLLSPLNNDSGNENIIEYLSTNITPYERRFKVKRLEKMLKENRRRGLLVVSTQVVEAGVDLDFDTVVRDIGPLDSIIQVAGRCNRFWNRSIGDVHVVHLVDRNGQLFSTQVYRKRHVEISRKLLENDLTEKRLPQLLEKYYEEVKGYEGVSDESRNLKEDMEELNFLNILKGFNLIEDEPKTPVFIELNSEASATLGEYERLLKKMRSRNTLNLRMERKSLLSKIEEFTVLVRAKDPLPQKTLGPLYYVAEKDLERFYDKETGYKRYDS